MQDSRLLVPLTATLSAMHDHVRHRAREQDVRSKKECSKLTEVIFEQDRTP